MLLYLWGIFIMTVILEKGESVPLKRSLSKVKVGMGWNLRRTLGEEFDLDVSCFMLNDAGKVRGEADFIFYNHLESPCGSVKHLGDNRNGEGEGDDEQILVDLSLVPEDVESLVFTATIYKASQRGQHFGQVDDSFIRLVDMKDGCEIAKYELKEDACTSTAFVFGELYRCLGDWKFRAVGHGYDFSLGGLAQTYGISDIG